MDIYETYTKYAIRKKEFMSQLIQHSENLVDKKQVTINGPYWHSRDTTEGDIRSVWDIFVSSSWDCSTSPWALFSVCDLFGILAAWDLFAFCALILARLGSLLALRGSCCEPFAGTDPSPDFMNVPKCWKESRPPWEMH